MAELAAVAMYESPDDLLDTPVTVRDHLCNPLLSAKGTWLRTMRRILDSCAGPEQGPTEADEQLP